MNKKNILIVILLAIILVLIIVIVKGTYESKSVVKNKVSTTNELYSEDTKAMEIKTSYCNLYFPKKWEKNLNIKKLEKDNNSSVQFWAKIDKKEPVHIFDIIFDGDGYTIGTIKDKNGKKININVKSYETNLDNTWTKKEKNTIYSIGEDINYLLLQLEKVDGFEPAKN